MLTGESQVCIAYAGSGKTGTGVEVAHALTGATGYFLFFNRTAAQDAHPRLPGRIAAMTGHSLAFRHIVEPSAGFQAKLAGELDGEDGPKLNAAKIAEALNLTTRSAPEFNQISALATCILSTINAFQISAARDITSDHVPSDHLPIAVRQGGNPQRARECQEAVAALAARTWARMANERDPFPVNHDTYLKLLQLREMDLRADIWILDEYQDTTPAMAEVVRQQTGQKLFIGDPNQAIYAWRGAINALNEPVDAGFPVHHLTESFRYNHQIAGLATLLLRATGQHHPVQGQPRNLLNRTSEDPNTIICRNNLSLIEQAVAQLQQGANIRLDGAIPSTTKQRLLSALALFENRTGEVKVSTFKELGSWAALVSYVHGLPTPPPDYLKLIELVETYRSHLPDLLNGLNKASSRRNHNKRGPTVTLITAHRAKGRQWPFVTLDDDLALSPTILGKVMNGQQLTIQERESINLLYVAITRAELGLTLPPAIKRNFATLHQNFSAPDDTEERFTASTKIPPPPHHERILQRHRTQEFIRAHRR